MSMDKRQVCQLHVLCAFSMVFMMHRQFLPQADFARTRDPEPFSCSAPIKGREGKCTAGAWLLHDFCMSGYWQGYMHMMQATIWSSKTSSFWWQNVMSSFTWRLCFLVFLGSNLAMLQPGRNLEVQSLSVDGGARGPRKKSWQPLWTGTLGDIVDWQNRITNGHA